MGAAPGGMGGGGMGGRGGGMGGGGRMGGPGGPGEPLGQQTKPVEPDDRAVGEPIRVAIIGGRPTSSIPLYRDG